jgi:hypothetical protein
MSLVVLGIGIIVVGAYAFSILHFGSEVHEEDAAY